MIKPITNNNFTGGLNRDHRKSLQPQNTYRYALNAVTKTRDSSEIGLANELSLDRCGFANAADIIGLGYVDERNWTIAITKDGSLYKHDHRTCEDEPIMSPSEFGCDWGCTDCEWVGHNMQFKTMDPCSELHLYFSCGCNYYRINIDLMLDPARKAGLIKELGCDTKCGLTENCEYFKIFKTACAPKLSPKSYESGGGTLKAGAYQFVVRLRHSDGGWTNWFHHSDPVFVGSEHNIGGEDGNGHIQLSMSCLDCKFAEIEIGVIERIGGNINTKTLGTVNYGNNHYSYEYYGQDGTPVPPEEFLVKDNTYLEGKHLIQKDSRMLYYGLKHFKNLNYQYKANQIITGYNVYEMPYEHARKNNIRSLMRGETYAFGIVWNYNDGTHSKVFNIPGVPSGGSGSNGTSQDFESTFNPDPTGGGSSGGGGVSGGSSSTLNLPSLSKECEYSDDTEGVDLTFDMMVVTDGDDTLRIDVVGNTDPTTPFIDCIKECTERGGTKIIIVDYNGNISTFDSQKVLLQNSNSITVSGSANNSIAGNIKTGTVIHYEKQSATAGGSGGGSSGGGGGGGQSQPNQPNVTISKVQKNRRKREPIKDQVHNPQNDHFDDRMQSFVNKMTTVVEDQCEEIRLHEDALRAQCCMCGSDGSALNVGISNNNYVPLLDGSGNQIANSAGDPVYTNGTDNAVDINGSFYMGDANGDPIITNDTLTPSLTGDNISLSQSCCESGAECDPGKAYEQCVEDQKDVDQIAADLSAMLDDYIEKGGKDTLDPNYDTTSMKDAAQKMVASIKKRERWYREKEEWSLSKSVSYGGGSQATNTLKSNATDSNPSILGDRLSDCCGTVEAEHDIVIVSSGRTEPDFETDIRYPCITDCSGNFMYGGLADTPVAHHKFPTSAQEPHYVSKSIGVPHGKYWGSEDETSDAYVRVMGPRFDNITFPTESEVPKPICPHNPYTIVMVKRTEANRKVLLKGLATGTYRGSNGGKDYVFPKHGVNSFEHVNRYVDEGGKYYRIATGGSDSNNFNIFSLDGVVRKPALNVEFVRNELTLRGKGERYGLYAKGDLPFNDWTGERLDKLGARQSVNLNVWESAGGADIPLQFKIYAPAKGSAEGGGIAPPTGGDTPLMQAYQQESIWIGATLPVFDDQSFVGDVGQHNAPINDATGSYVGLIRDLPNQYGNLENLNYIPILQSGKNHGGSIHGPNGDIYIGPYSFVKTGYVSDKVGSCDDANGAPKFDIPGGQAHWGLPVTKNERRCICDGPEDPINHHIGAIMWTELPESGDLADPKNYAGLHSPGEAFSRMPDEAAGIGSAETDYYYPRTVTTNITFWGEFEVNPWMREKSDQLSKQWYPYIKTPEFHFDSGVEVDANGGKWDEAYLNQFGAEIRQPSRLKKVLKTAIRTAITVIMPMLGIDDFFDMTNGIEVVGNLADMGLLAAFWWMMVQVLFRNDHLDKILGIPQCKTDEVWAHGDGIIRGFFKNPFRYNWDFSTMNDIYTKYCGIPDEYYVCDCDGCEDKNQTSNLIYYSDEQVQGSDIDAYRHVRPLNKVEIDPSDGKLNRLFNLNGNLYAHTTEVLSALQYGRVAIASTVGEIKLGTGGFLQYKGGGGPTEGFAGLGHHNHAIETQYGYFFIDQEAAKVYRFNGGSLEAISDKGNFNFFKENLPFCEETECKNELVAGTSYYAMGVDPRLNRFLITKKDGNDKGSFTMSYDLERGVWISEHTYIPRAYNWDRYNAYILTDDGYWRFHKDCDWGDYCGERGKFIVDFPAINTGLGPFQYSNTKINLEVEECSGCTWMEDKDIFFDKIALYNSTQSTGKLDVNLISDNESKSESAFDLIYEEKGVIKVHKKNRYYRFNEIYDLVDSKCDESAITICETCEPFEDVNQGIIDCSIINTQDWRNRRLEDKYLSYRYEYNNDKNVQFILISNETRGIDVEV